MIKSELIVSTAVHGRADVPNLKVEPMLIRPISNKVVTTRKIRQTYSWCSQFERGQSLPLSCRPLGTVAATRGARALLLGIILNKLLAILGTEMNERRR